MTAEYPPEALVCSVVDCCGKEAVEIVDLHQFTPAFFFVVNSYGELKGAWMEYLTPLTPAAKQFLEEARP